MLTVPAAVMLQCLYGSHWNLVLQSRLVRQHVGSLSATASVSLVEEGCLWIQVLLRQHQTQWSHVFKWRCIISFNDFQLSSTDGEFCTLVWCFCFFMWTTEDTDQTPAGDLLQGRWLRHSWTRSHLSVLHVKQVIQYSAKSRIFLFMLLNAHFLLNPTQSSSECF